MLAPGLRPTTLLSLVGGAVVGLVLFVIGMKALLFGGFPPLFGVTLSVIGVLGVVLGAVAAIHARRPAWAALAALWGVLSFCAFFAAPKVIDLPKLKSATVEMELTLGRQKAEEKIDAENLKIRFSNLAVSVLFALPFGLLCAGLVSGGRDFERTDKRRA